MAVLTSENYPERLAYQCISEYCSIVSNLPGYGPTLAKNFTSAGKKHAAQILTKFNEPSSFDELSKAQKNVDQVQNLVHEAIKKEVAMNQDINVRENSRYSDFL